MYYIEQLKGTYKKPPLHLLLLWKDKWIHALPSLTLFCYFTLSKNFKHSSLLPISEFVLDEKFLPAHYGKKRFKIGKIWVSNEVFGNTFFTLLSTFKGVFYGKSWIWTYFYHRIVNYSSLKLPCLTAFWRFYKIHTIKILSEP